MCWTKEQLLGCYLGFVTLGNSNTCEDTHGKHVTRFVQIASCSVIIWVDSYKGGDTQGKNVWHIFALLV